MKKEKKLQKLIKKLVDISFKDGKIVESGVVNSIKALKSLAGSEAILGLTEYLKQIKRLERKHTLIMETAFPLSFNQVQKIKKIMAKKYKITKLESKINPDILGGFKLRMGDEIWDETILGKINQVREAITSGRSN